MATMLQPFLQQPPSLTPFLHAKNPIPVSSSRFSLEFGIFACRQTSPSPSVSTSPSPMDVVNGNADLNSAPRSQIRLGLPSKGRMASDTLDLLKVFILFRFLVFIYLQTFCNYGIDRY